MGKGEVRRIKVGYQGTGADLELNVSLLLSQPQVWQGVNDKAVEVELHIVVLQVL